MSTLLRPVASTFAAALLLMAWSASTQTAWAADTEVSGSALRGDGPGLQIDQSAWPRWQGRIGIVADSRWEHDDGHPASNSLQSLTALGDYYFNRQGATSDSRYSGGFRASGGVRIGARGSWAAAPGSWAALSSDMSTEHRTVSVTGVPVTPDNPDAATSVMPYLGVGYTGLRSLQGTGGGWGFSADLGVMALNPRSAVRLGQQGVIDTLRDAQWSPIVQVGVSYSF